MSGTHLLAHWSRTQSCVALSSGEAELNAMLKAACEGLNLKYLHDEIGEERMLHLRGDSSASHGTLQRLGSGRVKHLQTRQLWLQEKVYNGEVSIEKIGRAVNWADSLTHAWVAGDMGHFNSMGIKSVGSTTPERVSSVISTKIVPNLYQYPTAEAAPQRSQEFLQPNTTNHQPNHTRLHYPNTVQWAAIHH